jgi:hypothetical protein|nr:MAG TPA: hypothetical protein [Caudoviricetes sp.]
MKTLFGVDNYKNYNLVCVLDGTEIHLIEVEHIYIDRYTGSMSVIGERLWVWSMNALCNIAHGIGDCTRQPLYDVKYFWTNWEEFKNLPTRDIYLRLGEYWEY